MLFFWQWLHATRHFAGADIWSDKLVVVSTPQQQLTLSSAKNLAIFNMDIINHFSKTFQFTICISIIAHRYEYKHFICGSIVFYYSK